VQFALDVPVDESSRPRGVGLVALMLCAFALASFFAGFFHPEISDISLASMFSFEHLPEILSGFSLLCAELFVAWKFWKGENWARILVLGAAFLIAAAGISKIVDHDGNVVVVMNSPLFFLEFAASIFLLYWLNTPPLRAWFNPVALTAIDLICSRLVGRVCTAVKNRTGGQSQSWHIAFEHDAELVLTCPWRIVLDDNLAFASNSIELPAEEEQPQQLLQSLRVKNVRVTPRTSDLFVTFEMGIELQTWSIDLHSPQWKFSDPSLSVIADSVGYDSNEIVGRNSGKDSTVDD